MFTNVQPACGREIQHRYFSQDPLTEQLMTASMPADGVEIGPQNARLKVDDPGQPVAARDENGNMLYVPTDPRFAQVQTFVAADRSLRVFERHLKRKLDWAFGREQMLIHPHAGNTINAFYNRQEGSINFYTHLDHELGKVVNSGHSAEIVSHESGHALLDGVRPEWINCLEDATGGFHEAFGDVMAFLVALEEPRNVDKLLSETGGDLKRPNSVARLAEEVSRALWDELNIERANHDYLRNANNRLVNADPATLPMDPPNENELGRAVHNYSRVMTGAMWDVLDSFHRQYQAQGFDVRQSLEKAREAVGALAIRGLDFCPVGHLPSYGDFARALLEVDRRDFDGRHNQMLTNLMAARNIHAPERQTVSELSLPEDGTTPFGAQRFLELHRCELGVGPDLPLTFNRAYSNELGEQFVLFRYDRNVAVQDDLSAVAQGGLLLVFDADGKLSYRHLNELTPAAEERLREAARAQLAAGEIRTESVLAGEVELSMMLGEDGQPYQGYLSVEPQGTVIKASPVRS